MAQALRADVRALPLFVAVATLLFGGCGAHHGSDPADLGLGADDDATFAAADLASGGDASSSAGDDLATPPPPCTTRIAYGDAWIRPAQHPDSFDVTDGAVDWDGVCHDDGANSYALLSNGWKPIFAGHSACVIALDQAHCSPTAAACATRISYGAAWLPPAGHAAAYDDVDGRVTWNRACVNASAQSSTTLSNGWAPHFNAADACALSLRYRGCGGLYDNAVFPDCADPGVVRDGDRYLVVCTSGNAANAFAIRSSPDLVHWTAAGHIFPAGTKPAWAASDFWAPEIHKVGAGWVAYFTARHTDGKLSIGAAHASSPLGPFVDIGLPLIHDANMGLIDATEFEAPGGARYLLWKEDGNAVGKPTPIHGQALAADGLSLVGARADLITNDAAWEGAVVEGPWLVAHGGSFYLFYSGNSYANATYAVGVARAAAPLGPYTKLGAPIVTSNATWIGPGHNSVVDGPGGDSYLVYHAWRSGHVNGPGDGRLLLVDRIVWQPDGWPALPGGPSTSSRPMP